MKVSAYTTLISIGVTIAAPNFITFGVAVSGIFTTPYHIIRHLVFVSERNRFYLKHNIDRNSKYISEN